MGDDSLLDLVSVRNNPRRAEPEEGWTLFAWDSRKRQWVGDPDYRSVSLDKALTAALKWKSMGQTIRLEFHTT